MAETRFFSDKILASVCAVWELEVVRAGLRLGARDDSPARWVRRRVLLSLPQSKESHGKSAYAFGPFLLEPTERRLLRDGQAVRLTPKVFDTLLLLVERPGQLVEKDDLMKALWPETFVEEVTLARNISALRSALGDALGQNEQEYIETVPKRGYRFIARVRRIDGPVRSPTPSESGNQAASSEAGKDAARERLGDVARGEESWASRPRAWRRYGLQVAAGMTLLAGAVVVFQHFHNNPSPSISSAGAIRSLVVLPLDNLSGDPGQEYLSDGLTDELITNLAQISALKVISRTSAMRYKATKKSLHEISSDLRVDGVVEGSVVRVGDRVRVTAQLIDAHTDYHLWAGKYERDLRDILSMQDEVARDIASEIRVKLTSREKERLANARPISPEAYQFYLKGLYYWNKRTEEGNRMAMENLQAAIDKDPAYAPPYAALSGVYTASAIFGWFPSREVIPKAKAAAAKALEIDDGLAEAHASLGIVSFQYEWDWAAAERHFEQAVTLNPASVNVHFAYSLYLSALGRTDQAEAEAERQLDLDPVSPVATFQRGIQLYRARRFDEAIAFGEAALQLDPNFPLGHWLLGNSHLQTGKFRQAVGEFDKYVALTRGSAMALGYLGYGLARAGDRDKARRVLAQLTALSKQRYVPAYYFALVYAGLSQNEQALSWLEKAYDEHSGHLAFLKVQAEWDVLRQEPRFASLLRRVGLS